MSLRSKDESYNMRSLAGVFGGGGHVMASGAFSSLGVDAIITQIEAFDFHLSSEKSL